MEKKSSSQVVYRDLRRKILDFEIEPGARLTEHELAAEYAVSRTPVRAALQRLEVEGQVSILPKQGCFVRTLNIEQISEFYEVRIALESAAVEIACEKMPRESLQELLDVWNPDNYRQGDFTDLEEIKELEEAFHLTLAEGGGNSVLVAFLRDVNDNIRIIRRMGFPDEQSVVETFEEHYMLCELIMAGKKARARKAIIEHIRKSQCIARNITLGQLSQYRRMPGKLSL